MNGTIMEGLALPEGPASVPIRFKRDEKSKVQAINGDSINRQGRKLYKPVEWRSRWLYTVESFTFYSY